MGSFLPLTLAFFCVCGGMIKKEEKGEKEKEGKRGKKRKKEEKRGKEGKEREVVNREPVGDVVGVLDGISVSDAVVRIYTI